MQIEHLTIVLRQRNNWEAVDLGMRMVTAWWRAIYAPLAAITLTLVLILIGLSFADNRLAAFCPLIFWWLKPMYDRISLYVISRCVFGEIPTFTQTLKAMPGVWLHSRLLRSLTWARFTPLRSLNLPIDLLEGLDRQEAKERRRIISRRVGATETWLTIVFSQLEYYLGMALLFGLFISLVPPQVVESLFSWDMLSVEGIEIFSAALNLAFALTAILISPFYTAGGFSLYLKRRSDLEAWDVELQLRQLANAHQARQKKKTSHSATHPKTPHTLILALCSLLCLTSLPEPASAQNAATQRNNAIREASTQITEILKDPDFGGIKKEKELRFKNADQKRKKVTPQDIESYQGPLTLFAQAIRFLGWVAIAGIVVWLIRLLIRNFGGWEGRNRAYVPPADIGGLDIRPESLPDDIPGEARRLIKAGKKREGLSLLLRGSLSILAHQYQVPFTRGDTEEECLRRVKHLVPALSNYFSALVTCWTQLAYAHQDPGQAELLALCTGWSAQFHPSTMRSHDVR